MRVKEKKEKAYLHTTSKAKPVVPQLTFIQLSSDDEKDDTSLPVHKKPKLIDHTRDENPCEKLVTGHPSRTLVQPPNQEGAGTSSSTPRSSDAGLSDFWKESGFSGAFTPLSCRSVRLGSYKFLSPNSQLLFSSQGIVLRAPIYDPNQPKPLLPSPYWTTVVIPVKELLKVQVHFNRKLPVIFFGVTRTFSQIVSKQLGLTNSPSGPYWDSKSQKAERTLLTVLPFPLMSDSTKNDLEEAFARLGIFQRIDAKEANRLLVLTAFPDVLGESKQLHEASNKRDDTNNVIANNKTSGPFPWEQLNLSPKELGSMPYRNIRVQIYQHIDNLSETIHCSNKRFFYMPLALLDYQSVVNGHDPANNEIRLRIEMWNEDVEKQLADFLSNRTGKPVSAKQIQVVPFERVLLTTTHSFDGAKDKRCYRMHKSLWFTLDFPTNRIAEVSKSITNRERFTGNLKLLLTTASEVSANENSWSKTRHIELGLDCI